MLFKKPGWVLGGVLLVERRWSGKHPLSQAIITPIRREQIECLERYRDTQDNKVMDKERQWGRETMWIKGRGGGRWRRRERGDVDSEEWEHRKTKAPNYEALTHQEVSNYHGDWGPAEKKGTILGALLRAGKKSPPNWSLLIFLISYILGYP